MWQDASKDYQSWNITDAEIDELPLDYPLHSELLLTRRLLRDLRLYLLTGHACSPGANFMCHKWDTFVSSDRRDLRTLSSLRCVIFEDTLGFVRLQVDLNRSALSMRVGVLKYLLAAIDAKLWKRNIKDFTIIKGPVSYTHLTLPTKRIV